MSISDIFKGDGYGRDGKNHGFGSPNNTTGVIVGDGKTAAEAKKAQEISKAKGTNFNAISKDELEAILFVLDIAGVIPGVGMVADGAAGIIRASTGDWGGAFYSLLGFVPLAGDLLKGSDLAIRIAKNPKFYLGQLQKARIAARKLGKEYKKVIDFFERQYNKIEDFIYSKAPKGSLPTRTKKNDGTGLRPNNAGRGNIPCVNKSFVPGSMPINAIYGCKFLDGSQDTDFTLTGNLPLIWDKEYASNSIVGRGETGDPIGWYGQGWSNMWSMQLHVYPTKDLIEVIDSYGRIISFPYIDIGNSFYSRFEDIRLHHNAEGQYAITSGASEQGEGVQLHFECLANNDLLSYPREQRFYCIGQSDNYNNRITLEYHKDSTRNHLPQYIKDSAGRLLQLDFGLIKGSEDKGLRLQEIIQLVNLNGSLLPQLISILNKSSQKSLQQAYDTDAYSFIKYTQELVEKRELPNSTLDQQSLVTYQYNAEGDLVKVNPYLNPTRRFDYNNHIMVAHHIDGGLSSYYQYDQYHPDGKVIYHHINNGRTFHLDYRTDHTLVVEAKDTKNERQTLYYFNEDKRWTGITDGIGNRTTFVLDDYDRVTHIIRPDGSKTLNQYAGDTLTAIKQLIDHDPITNMPQWRTQQYLYDNNRLTELLDPLGHSTKLAYDSAGQIKQVTDANGNSTQIERDNKGRVVKQTLANGSSYHYDYNDKGELIAQTDCSGSSTHYQYDVLGRITLITDAKNNQTHLTYDHKRNGHSKYTSSPTHILYPDGTQEHFVYDAANRLTKHSDAKQQTTQYDYATDDLPLKRIDALGHTLQYDYDNLRRLVKLTNENGESWTFTYDKADNLVTETRFDGTTTHYEYDKNGQLVHQTDNPTHARFEQRHTYLQRDLIGQLTHKHSLDIIKTGGKNTGQHSIKPLQRHHKTKYQYDIAGQLIRAISPDASTQLDYDPIGQLISETLHRHHAGNQGAVQDKLSNTLTQTLTHQYDKIGNRIATTLPDGKVINQLYYGSGHLYNQSITDNEGNITEIRHSERNQLHQETTRQQGELLSSFGYDAMGRLTKQYSSNHNKGRIVVQRDYNYDVLGQLTHLSGQTRIASNKKDNISINSHYTRNHQYDYDKVGRLTQHKLTDYAKQSGVTELFAFDPASNRVPVSVPEPSVETMADNGIADNSQNSRKHIHKSGRPKQLTTHDSYITYTYDSHGRVLFKTKTPLGKDGRPLKQSSNSIVGYLESLQLYYNANDELEQSIKIEQRGFDLVTITTTYYYDAFGRRIAKLSHSKSQSRLVANKLQILPIHRAIQRDKTEHHTTLILWDGNRQAQEYTDTHVFTTVYEQDSFEPVARLVWLRDELAQASNDEPINNERLFDENKPKSNMQVYHYHNDHLGTPNELTNQEGEVVWLADYEAWGNTAKVVWREEKLEQLQVAKKHFQPIRFQGQFYDEETGLHYNRFRYFDPDLGMFISRDPIGLLGGSNVFQYAPNPTGWVDPFGLSSNPCLEFANRDRLLEHFEKHGGEFGAKSAEEYLSIAQNTIKDGIKIEYPYQGEIRTGYVQFMGNAKNGNAKFAFVGTNKYGQITTLHSKSGKDFWRTLDPVTRNKVINSVE